MGGWEDLTIKHEKYPVGQANMSFYDIENSRTIAYESENAENICCVLEHHPAFWHPEIL